MSRAIPIKSQLFIKYRRTHVKIDCVLFINRQSSIVNHGTLPEWHILLMNGCGNWQGWGGFEIFCRFWRMGHNGVSVYFTSTCVFHHVGTASPAGFLVLGLQYEIRCSDSVCLNTENETELINRRDTWQ